MVEVTSSADEGRAQVRLHDNQSGMLLKRIPLMESWDEVSASVHAFRYHECSARDAPGVM